MMLSVSTRSLKFLAALVWYVGGIVLLLKGGSLVAEAVALRPGVAWPWIAVGVALLAGGLQAKVLFSKGCKKNLVRIDALDRPRLWQFFRPGFFVALAAMILAGAALSRLAHHNYSFLLVVAALDLNIAVALLGSSTVFWRERAFTA